LGGLVGEDGRDVAERYVRGSEVRSALGRLPKEQRKVLTLAYFGGYTRRRSPLALSFPSEPSRRRRFEGCAG
jgi:RNA polymerase sigma-70 factor, ECF subfamily